MLKKIISTLMICALLGGAVPVYAETDSEPAIHYDELEMSSQTLPEGANREALIKKTSKIFEDAYNVPDNGIQTLAVGTNIYEENEPNDTVEDADVLHDDYTMIGSYEGDDEDAAAFYLNGQYEVAAYFSATTKAFVAGVFDAEGELVEQAVYLGEAYVKDEATGEEILVHNYYLTCKLNAGTYYVALADLAAETGMYAYYFDILNYSDQPSPFVDVKPGDYYFDAVLWAKDNNITTGATETEFMPDKGCTRAQVVTFLWRAAGKPAPSSNNNPFTDLVAGEYYYDAVLWAVEKGITTGTTFTTFEPEAECTRAQIVTFIWRYFEEPATSSAENPFVDIKAGEYYSDAVLWAVENGITNGTSATTFAPGDTCTRGQIVTFLYRAIVQTVTIIM